MRADARRNRDRLVRAATELVLEVGAEPTLDAVARRAGVGIGTLYRHFPDRRHLLEAVAHRALTQAATAAEKALAEASDGSDAVRRYVHAAVEQGVGVLNLVRPWLDDPDWTTDRAHMSTLLDAILERGKSDGGIRPDTQLADIVYPIIRFSRPIPLGLAPAEERLIAHRHLDIYVDGLSPH